ncbi:MAG TPA: peptide-methionine (R)-S-oxide reductase MsrB [Candidatus Saccharimonadales bacterium]|nr:peptide-methionine (R)-S-oxide reductase MsrB [Candidatus Saccharimonadales bacterium]
MSSDKPKQLNTDLTDEQKRVLFDKATEQPFTGKFLHNKDNGMYTCINCGQELFSSDTKFDSGSGWPSFYDVAKTGAVKLETDNSLRMSRTEVVCSKCGAHLGHVFDDGPADKTGQRYCINSVCLDFKPEIKP